MKKILNVFVIAALLSTGACKKDDDNLNTNIVGLGGDTWTNGPIDQWIYDNYVKPYNIEVKYKWDRSEINIGKDVVPVLEDKVIPAMDAIKKTWINPYTEIAGEDFIKKYSHKQFYLAGSPEYNTNGTITLGTAEAGRKVVLFVLNYFDQTNKPEVRRMLHTIHHEFGHILNQNVMINPDYKRITPTGYTSVWANYTDAQALDLGFITAYSRSNPDDDFVEMLATLLVDGQASFNHKVNNLFVVEGGVIKRDAKGVYEKNTTARAALLQKEQLVVTYMKEAFGINLTQLQEKTLAAIDALAPLPAFNTLLGPGKGYTTVTVNPQKLSGLSSAFTTAYNTANTRLLADFSVYIEDIQVLFTTANKMTLRVRFSSPTGAAGNLSTADFVYDVATNTNGAITLTYSSPQPTNANARAIEASIPTLLAYFNGAQFNVRWVEDIVPQSKGIFGGFVKVTDPASYFFGTL